MNANGEGIAICTCGCELEVRCTGGCAEPDAVFQTAISLMSKPRRGRAPKIHAPWKGPGFCNYLGCNDPIVHLTGKGRPPKKCQKHLDMIRGYRDTYEAKKAATRATA